MKRVFLLLLLVAASCEPVFAQNQSINELRRMFDYDQNAPLDIKEVGVTNRNGIRQYAQAASEPKLVLWYDTGHELNDLQSLSDRANWLQRHIGIGPVAPILRQSFPR